MAIYDRWHLTYPENHPGWEHDDPEKRLEPCRCSRGKNRLYPSADHPRPGARRKKARWQVRYRDDAGEQQKKDFHDLEGDDPERHAKAYDAKVNHELDTDTYTDPELGKTPLEKFAKEWRAGQVTDLSTLENIDKRLAHIYDVEAGPKSRRAPGSSNIAPMPMGKLARNPHAIQQWIKGLQAKGLSPGYIAQIVDTLSSIFIAAMDNGVVSRNPVRAQSVRLPPKDTRLIVPWTGTMVAAARTSLEKSNGTGAVVDLGVGAGLRQGEIFGIAETDVVFLGRREDRKIRVRRQVKIVDHPETGVPTLVFALPKGGKEREVPLSDSLGKRLSTHIREHHPVEVTLPWRTPDSKRMVTVKLLFVRPDGRPWHRQTYTFHWYKARKAAGAEATRENGMHILRHTYASIELAALVDVLKLAAWLGHSDPGFTLRKYGHFIPDVADRGRAAVDAFLASSVEGAEGDASALDVP